MDIVDDVEGYTETEKESVYEQNRKKRIHLSQEICKTIKESTRLVNTMRRLMIDIEDGFSDAFPLETILRIKALPYNPDLEELKTLTYEYMYNRVLQKSLRIKLDEYEKEVGMKNGLTQESIFSIVR